YDSYVQKFKFYGHKSGPAPHSSPRRQQPHTLPAPASSVDDDTEKIGYCNLLRLELNTIPSHNRRAATTEVGRSNSAGQRHHIFAGKKTTTSHPTRHRHTPQGAMADEVDSTVDLSAASYSRKKSAELKAIRAARAANRDSAVSSIIASMNERGIGGVKLNNVHVEAFIHKQVEEETNLGEGTAGHDAAYERAVQRALAHAESGGEFPGEDFGGGGDGSGGGGGNDGGSPGTGARSGRRPAGGAAPSSSPGSGDGTASMETYLQQAFQSSRGFHGNDGRDSHGYKSRTDHADAAADEFVKPDDHDRLAAIKAGADDLTAAAYANNAAHNVPYSARKLNNAGNGEGGPLMEQKDVEDVVEDMAERQANRMKGGAERDGEVFVPERSEAEAAYEEDMRRMRAEAKERDGEAPGAQHVASALVGNMAAADEETLKALAKPKGATKEEDGVLDEDAAEDAAEGAEEGQANGAAGEVADEEADEEDKVDGVADEEGEEGEGETDDEDAENCEADDAADEDAEKGEGEDAGPEDVDGVPSEAGAQDPSAEDEEGEAEQEDSAGGVEEEAEVATEEDAEAATGEDAEAAGDGEAGEPAEEEEDGKGHADDAADFAEPAEETPPEVASPKTAAGDEGKPSPVTREAMYAGDVDVPAAASKCCCVVS
ncbi:hypothetical protein ACHAXT_002656, partial [Thalassiosira profunda]